MGIKDISGLKFGKLTVLELLDCRKGYARWVCLCACGCTTIALGTHLRQGNTTSCGCAQRESARKLKTTHGMLGTPTYLSWQNMLRRCCDPNNPRYMRYGGRGITVCKRWRDSFENFLQDMGPRPSVRHCIEREDPNGSYKKSNCTWLLKRDNTVDTYKGRLTKRGMAKVANLRRAKS